MESFYYRLYCEKCGRWIGDAEWGQVPPTIACQHCEHTEAPRTSITQREKKKAETES